MNRRNKPYSLNLQMILLVGTALLLLGLQIVALLPNITTPIERVEYSARDLLMRMRGVRQPPGDVVIVAIDDFSLNWSGLHWPWPRSYLAKIVDQINKGGAKVVGLDIFLFEPDPDPLGDQALAKAIGESPASASVMQIFQQQDVVTLRKPLAPYRNVFDGLGITAFNLDEDAVLRAVQAYDTYGGNIFYHWDYEIARLYLGGNPPSNANSTRLIFNGRTIPLQNGQMLVNYAGPPATYPTYSASSVYEGDVLAQNPDAFRNKIVLIGATTVTLQDVYATPFSAQNRMPGVEVVANAVDTILHNQFLWESPPWFSLLITVLAAIVAGFITRSQRPSGTITLLTVSMVTYGALGLAFYDGMNFILPIVVPEAMLFLGVVLPTLEQAVSQELEKRRVRSLFTRFISPEMVDQMMATQDLNSLNKRSNLTILFSDIRGFTTLSEKLSPDEVVAILNPYLEAMTRVIHQHGGTVDKYEGDAIVAFFGEPVPFKDHALRAMRASLDMRKALAELWARWNQEGRPITIEMGIGLNSGDVFVGMLGSEQRINYTIIGDNANLASRLQDLTKTYAWPILISESTYKQVNGEFDAELVDSVLVKGKTEPVNVYKVIGRKGAPPSEQLQSWKK